MKVAIVFEAPDEFAGADFSPEQFLMAYRQRNYGINIDVMVHLVQPKAEVLEPFKVGDPVKFLEPIPAPEEILEQARRLQEEIVAQTICPILPDERIGTDGSWAAMEARDRRQQHKLAVKFSNRRK